MSYRWVEHTGELELELRAQTETGVFEEALVALAELLVRQPDGVLERRHLQVGGRDLPTQLVAWLDELVFLAETEGYVARRVAEIALAAREVSATVEGHRGKPPHLVKGVTYHDLAFDRGDRQWLARVVLDV